MTVMVISYLDKILFALISFFLGYFYAKSGGLTEETKKQIKKKIKGSNYGAVIKPKKQEQIDKEQSKEFYEKL